MEKDNKKSAPATGASISKTSKFTKISVSPKPFSVKDLSDQNNPVVNQSSYSINMLNQTSKYHLKRDKKHDEQNHGGGKGGLAAYKNKDIILLTRFDHELRLDETAAKVDNIVRTHFYRTGELETRFSLKEFRDLTGENKTTASRKLVATADNLAGLRLRRANFKDADANKKRYEPAVHNLVLYVETSYENGEAYFRIDEKYGKALKKHGIKMVIDPLELKLKKNAFFLLNALTYNKQVNLRNKLMRQDRMKMSALLEKLDLTPWDKAKKKKNIGQNIVKPIDKAIKEIEKKSGGTYEFKFVKPSGEKVDSVSDLDYGEFLNSYIVVSKWNPVFIQQVCDVHKVKRERIEAPKEDDKSGESKDNKNKR